MTGGEVGHRAGVDHDRPCRDQRLHLLRGERFEAGDGVVTGNAALVHRGELAEVAGEGPEPVEEAIHELVLRAGGEQRVGGTLPADRRGALPTAGGRAERTGAVGRVDREVVGKGEDPLGQGPVQVPRQLLALVVAQQVGAADGPDHQRAPREQHDGSRLVDQEVGEVVGGVTGGGDHVQLILPISMTSPSRTPRCSCVEARGGWREEGRARGGELGAPGDVVSVGVGVGGEGHRQAAACRLLASARSASGQGRSPVPCRHRGPPGATNALGLHSRSSRCPRPRAPL